jgi:uncharacterized protein involved in exopolysaccharide biosynthesis/MinD-like ATPase involved in chromosome partitioning or flagellar assembly
MEGELNFKKLTSIIFKYKKVGIFFSLFIFFSFLVSIIFFPKTYETKITIFVQKNNSFMETRETEFPQYQEVWLKSQANVIKSERILSKVVYAIDNRRDNINLAKLRKAVIVEVPKDTNIITIKVRANTPQLAKSIGENLIKFYGEEKYGLEDYEEGKGLEFIGNQITMTRNDLKKLEKELVNFKEKNRVQAIQEQKEAYVKNMNELNQKYILIEAKLNQVKESMRILNKDYISLVDEKFKSDSYLWHLQQELAKKEAQLAEYEQKYTKFNPLLSKAKGERIVLRKKVKQEIEDLLYSELQKLNQEKKVLEHAIDIYTKMLASIPLKEAKINQLEKEISLKREVLTALEKKKESLYLAMEMTKEKISKRRIIKVLEKPNLPQKPIRPKPLIDLIVGCFLSIFGGIGTMLLLGYWDHSFERKDDVEKHLSSKYLGTIFSGSKVKTKKNPGLVIPDEYISISYKLMDTPASILITSAKSGEGKTNATLGIAYALAENSSKKVLIIDADFQSPSLGDYFGLSNKSQGLIELLSDFDKEEEKIAFESEYLLTKACNLYKNKETYNEAIKKLIYPTTLPNLEFMPLGNNLKSNSFNMKKFKKTLSILRENYDFVIVDGPSIIDCSQTVLLTKCIDKVLVVIRAGLTKYEVVKYAESILKENEAKIEGIIINDKKCYIPERIYRWL